MVPDGYDAERRFRDVLLESARLGEGGPPSIFEKALIEDLYLGEISVHNNTVRCLQYLDTRLEELVAQQQLAEQQAELAEEQAEEQAKLEDQVSGSDTEVEADDLAQVYLKMEEDEDVIQLPNYQLNQ